MTEQVDDGCTTDRCFLLSDMGVHMKTPLHSSSQRHENAGDLTGDLRELGNKGLAENCECIYRHTRCKCLLEHGVRKGMVIAMVFGCLLVSICSLAFALQQSRVHDTQMEDMKHKVDRLNAFCGLTTQWPASDVHVSSDSVNDKSPFDPDQLPWQQNTNYPGRLAGTWLQAGEQDELHQNIKDGHTADIYDEGDEDGHVDSVSFFAGKSRQKRNTKGKRLRNGPKACKRLEKCMKVKKSGKKVNRKCEKMLKCIPPPAAPQAPKAVHFMSNFWKDRRQKKFGRETPLHFYKEADWMAKVYKDTSQKPIVATGDGGYNVTQSGLYLIYSSVMFHDMKPRQSQALVVNGEKRFKCMDSVDYVDKTTFDRTRDVLAKYKTCAMTGVTHLNVNDRLEVQNLYAETEIDLSTDATYFGAVLLTPGEIDRSG